MPEIPLSEIDAYAALAPGCRGVAPGADCVLECERGARFSRATRWSGWPSSQFGERRIMKFYSLLFVGLCIGIAVPANVQPASAQMQGGAPTVGSPMPPPKETRAERSAKKRRLVRMRRTTKS